MSSDFDDIRPVSAPTTGPDPRISAPTASANGVDLRTVYQMPAPPAQADVRDFDPAPDAGSDPGFNYDGTQTTSAAEGDAVSGHRIAAPSNPTDVRDLDPAPRATTGGGQDSGGIQLMSAGGRLRRRADERHVRRAGPPRSTEQVRRPRKWRASYTATDASAAMSACGVRSAP
ncbi:hypothetical protein [Streptomyces sp. NPDC093591]|uniref:hypothetical protein n=1 Tax=Streptomyces sp. NPDC093591 TaxID=3366044 RepID=UPI0037FCEA20